MANERRDSKSNANRRARVARASRRPPFDRGGADRRRARVALASRARRARVALASPTAGRAHTHATTPRDDAATTRRRREIRHRRPDVARDRPGAATGAAKIRPVPDSMSEVREPRLSPPSENASGDTTRLAARANDRAAQGGGFPSRCLAGDSDATTDERIVTLRNCGARVGVGSRERTYRVCSPGINRSVSTRAVERR